MKRHDVRWLSAAALSLAALASGSMESGGQLGRAAWAVEPVQVPLRSLTTEEIRLCHRRVAVFPIDAREGEVA